MSVHVWLADPGQVPEPAARAAAHRLSDDERERWQRLRRAPDRHLFLVAHLLVRTALSRHADVPPESWAFRATEQGRPEIRSPEGTGLRFSLSHTDGLAACLVCREWACGVDVEPAGARRDPMRIARRYFTPGELELLEGLPETERHDRFLRIWTLKEAFLKARGTGIAGGLDRIEIRPDGAGGLTATLHPDLDEDRESWLLDVGPRGRHILALAVRCGPAPHPVPVVETLALAGEPAPGPR